MMGNQKFFKTAFGTLILFLLLILLPCVFLCAKEDRKSEVIRKAGPKIIQIINYDKKGKYAGRGSGFFIGPDKILTCEHVINGAYSAEAFNEKNRFARLTILKKDKGKDIALLKVNGQSKEGFLPLEEDYNINQKIIVIGYPDGAKRFSYDGSIIKDKTGTETKTIQISAPIYRGMSGGPVLNPEGRVMGVSYYAANYKNEYLAIGLKTIKEFLNSPYNPRQLHEAKSVIFWALILAKTGEFYSSAMDFLSLFFETVLYDNWIKGIFIGIFIGGLFVWTGRSIYKYKAWTAFQRNNQKNANKRGVKFYCWKCGKKINVESFNASHFVICRGCRTIIEVPAV